MLGRSKGLGGAWVESRGVYAQGEGESEEEGVERAGMCESRMTTGI